VARIFSLIALSGSRRRLLWFYACSNFDKLQEVWVDCR
jgi:hypothetical protein